ncbi:MAG: ribosome small subunit-dependent GTPase A [Phycisphaerales bacterium]
MIRWTVPGHARVLLDPAGESAGLALREVDAVLPRKVSVPGDEESPKAVGDRVNVEWAREGPVVVSVERRHSTLCRRASGKRPARQVICANADTMVCVMAAADPEPRWGMLDRYLVIAELCGLKPMVVLSKSDLAPPDVLEAIERYRTLGYACETVCVRDHADGGVERLRARLTGHSSVIVGKSGVGKSTLLNALVPGASQVVGDVGKTTSKGRHTTTLAVLFEMAGADARGAPATAPSDSAPTPPSLIIDTPGVREIGPWGLEPVTVAHCFVEIMAAIDSAERAHKGCRFAGSCTHAHETGCVVRDAVHRGEIHPERYDSYLRLRETIEQDEG